MREKRYFSLRRRTRQILTPDKLMSILNQTEGGESAKDIYRKLTGEDPPAQDIDRKEDK